ncbi:MAG: hypothetical protein GOU99_02170 [Candidatus Altiarchaeota archaeon]|nr:hypothetical protein [Candidatus Altiarchaeota archaeon]
MKIYLGLFTHIDLVARGTLDRLIELKKLAISEPGKEYFVTKRTFEKAKKIFPYYEKRIGGNAGNAAYFLNQLGVEHIVAMPVKSRETLQLLGPHSLVFNRGLKQAMNIKSSQPAIEHLAIEIPLNLVEGGGRILVSSDKMTREMMLDKEFMKKTEHGLLFLSGFHLINKKHKYKIGELVDQLETKPGLKIHLELGEPNEQMSYAFKKLVSKGLVSSVSMNAHEAKLISKSIDPTVLVEKAREFSQKNGLDVSIHTAHWAFSTSAGRLRTVVDIIQAYALGELGFYHTVLGMPIWPTPKGAVGTRRLPWINRTVGLGDAFSVLDALRIHNPLMFEKTTQALLQLA